MIDSAVAGLQAARIAFAVAADDSVYEKAPISRGADVAVGAGFMALFLGSAIYGFSTTSRCQRLKRTQEEPVIAAPRQEKRSSSWGETDAPAPEADPTDRWGNGEDKPVAPAPSKNSSDSW